MEFNRQVLLHTLPQVRLEGELMASGDWIYIGSAWKQEGGKIRCLLRDEDVAEAHQSGKRSQKGELIVYLFPQQIDSEHPNRPDFAVAVAKDQS